jgi:flagellar motility protein MotE (MotC chaperone)
MQQQIETRINELRELESRANSAMQNKSENEAQSLKNLVTMYDNMKAKDAAQIFDRVDMRVLIEVASQRRMSDIMAQMQPRRLSGSPSSSRLAPRKAAHRMICPRSKAGRRGIRALDP